MQLMGLDYCCAVTEIGYLAESGTAEAAMREFCRQSWGGPMKEGCTLDAFYVFTGVLRHTKLFEWGDRPAPRGGKYGPEFKQFIKKHSLGAVVESPTRNNRANHENHFLKVYVWAPDAENLKKWWKEHR